MHYHVVIIATVGPTSIAATAAAGADESGCAAAATVAGCSRSATAVAVPVVIIVVPATSSSVRLLARHGGLHRGLAHHLGERRVWRRGGTALHAEARHQGSRVDEHAGQLVHVPAAHAREPREGDLERVDIVRVCGVEQHLAEHGDVDGDELPVARLWHQRARARHMQEARTRRRGAGAGRPLGLRAGAARSRAVPRAVLASGTVGPPELGLLLQVRRAGVAVLPRKAHRVVVQRGSAPRGPRGVLAA
jgi:hypothetical protein